MEIIYIEEVVANLDRAYLEMHALKSALASFFLWLQLDASLLEVIQFKHVCSIEHFNLTNEEMLLLCQRPASGKDQSASYPLLQRYKTIIEDISRLEEIINICSKDQAPEVVIDRYSTLPSGSVQESIENIDSALQIAHIEYNTIKNSLSQIQGWLDTSASLREIIEFIRIWDNHKLNTFNISDESVSDASSRAQSRFDLAPFHGQLERLVKCKKEIILLESLSSGITRDSQNRPEPLFISRVKVLKHNADLVRCWVH